MRRLSFISRFLTYSRVWVVCKAIDFKIIGMCIVPWHLHGRWRCLQCALPFILKLYGLRTTTKTKTEINPWKKSLDLKNLKRAASTTSCEPLTETLRIWRWCTNNNNTPLHNVISLCSEKIQSFTANQIYRATNPPTSLLSIQWDFI